MPKFSLGTRVSFDGRLGTVVGHRPSGMTDIKFDDADVERRHEDRLARVNGSYKAQIEALLRSAPTSWQKLFKDQGLPKKPSVAQLIALQEKTAGGNQAGPKGSAFGTPPEAVRKAALRGLVLSHSQNYPSWNGIGLARAAQLATASTISDRDAKRMRNYFSRHVKDKNTQGFKDQTSKGYLAWLNWGGDPGKNWVNSD